MEDPPAAVEPTFVIGWVLVACVVANGIGPLVVRRGRPWTLALAALTSGTALALPWALPTSAVFLRALSTLIALAALFRVVDLARDPRSRGLGIRLALAYGLVDARLVRPRAGRPGGAERPLGELGLRAVGFGASFALGIVVGTTGPLAAPEGGLPWALRVAVGLVTFYVAVEAIIAVIQLAYAAFGLEVGPLHRDPILSRTLGEFWSRRWNLTVARWLDRHAFRPLARRGMATTGRLAAFAASAAAHAYFALVPLGPEMAASIGAFFLAHGVLVVAEHRLAVPRWPTVLQRGWTLTAFVLTGPLIGEPALRILGNVR